MKIEENKSLYNMAADVAAAINYEEKGGSWALAVALYNAFPADAEQALRDIRKLNGWNAKKGAGKTLSNYAAIMKKAAAANLTEISADVSYNVLADQLKSPNAPAASEPPADTEQASEPPADTEQASEPPADTEQASEPEETKPVDTILALLPELTAAELAAVIAAASQQMAVAAVAKAA